MLLLATTLLAAATVQATDVRLGGPAEPTGDDLVRVTLLADRDAVRPGATFTLGVQLAIEPGWHVYWINPGDSGLPTKASVVAPAGFALRPVVFPGPERFELPGDIVNYGYADETLLWFDVTAPSELAAGAKVRFEVQASWLVCKEICLPGAGVSALELPTTTSDDARPHRANDALFAKYAPRLPRSLDELSGARLRWVGDEHEPRLELCLPGADEIAFYPLDDLAARLVGETVTGAGIARTLALAYRFRQRPSDAPWKARGLLCVVVNGGESGRRERFYTIDHAWDEPSDATPAGADKRPHAPQR